VKKQTQSNLEDRSPLVKVRQMILVVGVIGAIFAVPLLLVWKQAYIRGSSVKLEAMADTLSTLDKETSLLRLRCERLSCTERIESVARASLGLEYPSSDRMSIISMDDTSKGQSRKNEGWAGGLIAAVQDHLSKGGQR
jgi:cell division protein FtsL